MKSSLLIFVCLIGAVLFPQTLKASHAAGGELFYKCLGGGNYEVTYIFYRDCFGISAPNAVVISYSSSCGFPFDNLVDQSFLVLGVDTIFSGDEISPVCAAALPFTTCATGPLPGLSLYIYKDTVNLPPCLDWKINCSITARNGIIDNLVDPDSWDLYVETNMNNVVALCNNSVVFTQPYILSTCGSDDLHFNPGGIDPDGDSLVYSLVQPLDNSTTPIPYVFPYSATYPVTTISGDFPFDTETGQINFSPDMEQSNAIVIKVDEYRNGNWISSTLRDFQLYIENCTNNVPQTNSIISVSTSALLKDSNSVQTCPGDPLMIEMEFYDLDISDILTLNSNIDFAIPDAILTLSGTNPVILTLMWLPTLADTGLHPFHIQVLDNFCPTQGINVFAFDIKVEDNSVCPLVSCPMPTGNVESVLSSVSVKIHWDPVAMATDYIIEARRVPKSVNTIIHPNNTLSYNKLTPLSTYEWRVAADCGTAGVSPFTSIRSFTTPLFREINVEIFPNPVTDQINIIINSEKNYTAELINITGQSVYADFKIGSSTIDIENINPGFYFLQLSGEDFNLVRRINVLR